MTVDNLSKAKQYYLKEYEQYLAVERNLAIRTVKEYMDDLRGFFDYLAPYLAQELTLDRIDEATIREYMADKRLKRHYSPKAMNRKLASLRGYFAFLESEGHIPYNPVIRIKSAKLGKHLPQILTHDEMKALLAAPGNGSDFQTLRDRAIIELLYASGIRVSELVGLDLGNLDLQGGNARVRGKGNKDRIVLLNEASILCIQAYLKSRPAVKDRAVFINRTGVRLTSRTVEYMFAKYVLKSGITSHATPHTIRHSFATHLLMGGADLMTIKELLGHESLATTQIYTNISLEHIRETYRKSHPRE